MYMPDAQQYRTLSENSKYPSWKGKEALWDDHVLSNQKGAVSNGGLASSAALMVTS